MTLYTDPATLITEKQWRHTILELARQRGWHILSTFLSIRSPEGMPDLILLRPPRIVYAELKSSRGKLTLNQALVLELLRLCNAEVYAWWPDDWKLVEQTLM